MNKQTHTTQSLNSRPKHLTLRLFLDTVVYKGTRFKEKSILDVKTHFKQTETFLYTKKGFVRGEALRTLRKTPQKQPLTKIIQISKKRLMDRATHKR